MPLNINDGGGVQFGEALHLNGDRVVGREAIDPPFRGRCGEGFGPVGNGLPRLSRLSWLSWLSRLPRLQKWHWGGVGARGLSRGRLGWGCWGGWRPVGLGGRLDGLELGAIGARSGNVRKHDFSGGCGGGRIGIAIGLIDGLI